MSVQSHELHLLTGAYAVDALTGDELDEFEKHLPGCASCVHPLMLPTFKRKAHNASKAIAGWDH